MNIDSFFPGPYKADRSWGDNWGWVAFECIPVIGTLATTIFIELENSARKWYVTRPQKINGMYRMLRLYKALRVNSFLTLVTGVALRNIDLKFSIQLSTAGVILFGISLYKVRFFINLIGNTQRG